MLTTLSASLRKEYETWGVSLGGKTTLADGVTPNLGWTYSRVPPAAATAAAAAAAAAAGGLVTTDLRVPSHCGKVW